MSVTQEELRELEQRGRCKFCNHLGALHVTCEYQSGYYVETICRMRGCPCKSGYFPWGDDEGEHAAGVIEYTGTPLA